MKTFFILLFYCTFSFVSFSQHAEAPYQKGESYSFVVLTKQPQEFEFQIIDTISFEIKGKRFIDLASNKFQAEWISKMKKDYKELRTINLSKNNVNMEMPITLNYFQGESIAIAPYPYFSRDMKKDYNSSDAQTFSKDYKQLSGRNINQQKSIIAESFQLEFNGQLIHCKVAEGYNTSDIEELGRFQIVTYFHELYGFVMISYVYPSGEIIELRRI